MLSVRKVVTFRASSIGDGLMAKYLLENMHIQFPEAQLAIVVASRGGMLRDLFASSPYIEVIETNRRDIVGLVALWWKYRQSDLVVTQYAGKHGGQFSLASKFAARMLAKRGGLVGFADASRWNHYLFDHVLPVRQDRPVVEHEREALRAAGLQVVIPYPRIHVAIIPEVMERFSLVAGAYIVVHFFAGNTGRSISPAQARVLLVALQTRFPHTTLVLSGSGADRTKAEEIAQGLSKVMVVAGLASLQDMLQLVAASCVVVSVDTGVAHIAAQLNRPLVVMRTCLGPNWWFPEQYGPDASVTQFSREDLCKPHRTMSYPACITAIDMEEVARAADELVTIKN